MLKGNVQLISADHRTGKTRDGRDYDGYSVWMNIEGYQFPYKTWIPTWMVPGIELKKDMNGVVYIDQDKNLGPVLRYRFG